MFRTFWMVLGNGPTQFKHPTKDAACTEAERLARAWPGETFYVLEAVGAVVRSDVRWDDAHPEADSEIPF